MFEMAGLRQPQTGLPFYVYLSHRAGAKHNVRIKVSPGFKYMPDQEAIVGLRPDFHYIHGSLDRKDELLLRQWVGINLDTIMAFWNEEIDTLEMFENIQKI